MQWFENRIDAKILIEEFQTSARYHEITNARHFPMTEHPDIFSQIMMDWLSSKR